MKKVLFFPFLLLFCGLSAQAQFSHQLVEEKKPWTAAPQISGDSFRFMIIGDLTGNESPGYFSQAVARINDLAPDFVISVGDLIDGYTTSVEEVDRQWKSFDDRLAHLQMPFFYVSGNHDVSNRLLTDMWRDKLGRDYYAFTVGNNLFLVLNNKEYDTESGISIQQGQYIKQVLEQHSEVKQVFVFAHDATWDNCHKEGYSEFMPLLLQRNTTYFCGHRHRYRHVVYKDQKHFMLSHMANSRPFTADNIRSGAFNSLMHVSVKDTHVNIATMALDGLLPNDIVNDSNQPELMATVNKAWVQIPMVTTSGERTSILRSQLVIRNNGTRPFYFRATATASKGFTLNAPEIVDSIQPRSQKVYPIELTSNKGEVLVKSLRPIAYTIKGSYDMGDYELFPEAKLLWRFDHTYVATHESKELQRIHHYGYIEAPWDWIGLDDATLSYAVYHDKKNVYCHLRATDDCHVEIPNLTDHLQLTFASDTTFQIPHYVLIEAIPGKKPLIMAHGKQKIKGIKVTCTRDGNNIDALILIPKSLVKDNYIRLNFGFIDLDSTTKDLCSRLWFKPTWGTFGDRSQTGVFELK